MLFLNIVARLEEEYFVRHPNRTPHVLGGFLVQLDLIGDTEPIA